MAVSDGQWAMHSDGAFVLKADGTWGLSSGCCCGECGCPTLPGSCALTYHVSITGSDCSGIVDGEYDLAYDEASSSWIYDSGLWGDGYSNFTIVIRCGAAPDISGNLAWKIEFGGRFLECGDLTCTSYMYICPPTPTCPPEGDNSTTYTEISCAPGSLSVGTFEVSIPT